MLGTSLDQPAHINSYILGHNFIFLGNICYIMDICEYKAVGNKRRKIVKKEKNTDPQDGADNKNAITSENNHIYFYSKVSKSFCLDLSELQIEAHYVNNHHLQFLCLIF